mgnify:CR=1 FL=1
MRTTASVIAAAALLASAPLAAQDEPAQPAQQVHVVRPGETLWDIARACLSDPFLWPEIFRLNTGTVEDPALIYPSERLVLPACAGQPVAEGPFFGPPQEGPRGPTLRLGVTVEQPAVLQGDFYRAAFVAQPREVPLVGRLQEAEYQSVMQVRETPQFNLYDRVFVTVDPARDTPSALKTYASRFGPAVVGLTGDSAALAKARQGYGAYITQVPAQSASSHGAHASPSSAVAAAMKTVHPGAVYGIDRRGNLQVVISDGATPEQVVDDVRSLARL